MTEIPPHYNPKETEEKWYAVWENRRYFHAQPDPAQKPFTIVIPPPNVTGILHMGHALNNTIQDILIRYQRMKGCRALWMPGTDHAGIATQNVVEKKLAKEGLRRQDVGRDAFITRVWQWRQEYGSTIIHQLKKLGASCDWERLRFTMDEEYSRAVVEVFTRLYQKGLIYQGSYIINWCPRCQTALSDEEAPHQDLQGNLYYFRYPFKDTPSRYLVVATTRPETMLGDTAVAVHPQDARYKKDIGKTLLLPLVHREIKIIADTMVDMKFATGAVKVTPAHDPNDYCLGKKHNLEFINVMHPDARMNQNAGTYAGKSRFEAREAVVTDLQALGLVEKIEPHALSAGHCYRCHTIIEPYLSTQWFVKMKPLAEPAIEAVKSGKIKFYPQRWTKVYLNWMENIQDWCISRQIWWGHRIPVYYCRDCQKQEKPEAVIVAALKPETCPSCRGTDIYQDEDVLDTWFSSWLWPFATFYWPDKKAEDDLNYFYPTSVLVTAPEIIFFWVARMIMAGFAFMGKEPFRDIYIHGTVRDIEGKKMSKSLGNVIDPLEIINEYGADALRFSLIAITAQGQDVFLSKERFEQGRNFANKIWNASRFILSNLDTGHARVDLCVFFKTEKLAAADRWILSRFYSTLKEAGQHLEVYQFNEAAHLLYGFFWHEFCDWYLELIKPEITHPHHQVVMYKVLEKFVRVLHPFMPFVTEELWQTLPHEGDSIMTQPWPHLQEELIDTQIEHAMEFVCTVITALRTMRAEIEVPLTEKIAARIATADEAKAKTLKEFSGQIMHLAKLRTLQIEERYHQAAGEFVMVEADMHVVIPLTGLIDIQEYRQKLTQRIQKTKTMLAAKEATLANQNFVSRAPQEIVDTERTKLAELQATLAKLEGVHKGLT